MDTISMLRYLLDAPPDAKVIEAPPGTHTYYFSMLDDDRIGFVKTHTEILQLTQYAKFAAGYSSVGNLIVFSRTEPSEPDNTRRTATA